MIETQAYQASLITLCGWIKEKKISPTEVVQGFLHRIEQYNPTLNAYCTVASDYALDKAREAEQILQRGGDLPPLLGVPVAIKDLVPTSGIRTTYGSKIFADNIPNYDSVLVRRLKQAGAIILCKTNTPEFGYTGITDNMLFGRTNNPWDVTCTTGGSSGGSAAAVSACLAPVAEGSDGGGSIRIPASCCGIFGFKPSFGRIPYDTSRTCFSGAIPFLHEGFLTRTVDDAAFMLNLSHGPDSRDPFSLPHNDSGYFPLETIDPKKLRIAYSPDLDYFEIDTKVKQAVDRTVKTLESLGCKVETTSLSFKDYYQEVIKPFVMMWSVNLAAFYSEYLPHWQDHMTKGLVATMQLSHNISAVDYKRLEIARSLAYQKVEAIFAKYNILITPTLAVPAFPHAPGPREINGKKVAPYTGWMLTSLFNLTGHPAASINCGYSKAGIPIGMQIIGPRLRDELVLQFSKTYQEACQENFLLPDLNKQ